jgi:hypothetical protein
VLSDVLIAHSCATFHSHPKGAAIHSLLLPPLITHKHTSSHQVVLLQRQLGEALAELQISRERLADMQAIQVGVCV